MIPFADIKRQYQNHQQLIDAAVASVINDTAFIGGSNNPYVNSFEKNFAQYLGIKEVIGCANGTDSLEIILKAMGIGPGDEVIVPALSWISTSESVSAVGATPVFVDIDPHYYTINPFLIEAAITPSTKAIIPVHLYGLPADMNSIMQIANRHQLKVIEDCAQAHGATIDGRVAGTIGDAGSFSFYPGKNLGAYGDAGCIVTNNEQLALTCRMIANHGQQGKHNHLMEGRNSRLDGIHAAILDAKLPLLSEWTGKRKAIAEVYNQSMKDVKHVVLPSQPDGYEHVYHLYVIRNKKRNELQQWLKQNGVETAVHYPVALPLMPCYQHRGFTGDQFPVAAQCVNEILSLPMFPELTSDERSEVIKAIKTFA